MAAITINTTDANRMTRFLESQVITNQSGVVTRTRAVKVPGQARSVSFYLYIDSQTGTTPTLDFKLLVPDFGSGALFFAPDDVNVALLADFAGITQVTGAGPYCQTIDVGPDVTGIADDVTGAAAADARMAVNTLLPPWLVYQVITDGTTTDEDYTYRLVAHFRAQ
jgi:hypothetical protein